MWIFQGHQPLSLTEIVSTTSLQKTHHNSQTTNCHATLSQSFGGAISWYTSPSTFHFTIYNCRFSNNTAGHGGHLHVLNCSAVTAAQCTFTDSRSTSDSPLSQKQSILLLYWGDYRFDNCTISNNEGDFTGGLYLIQDLSSYSIVLTDVLFKDNICTDTTISQHVTDCIYYGGTDHANVKFFDCFSTSAQPHCGNDRASKNYPERIGPSIATFEQTIRENENGDGFEVVVSFEGVFTGTSRKYDVTLKNADGTEFVAEKVSFSKTTGTTQFPLNNPSVHSLHSSTSYSIVDVKKSPSQTTSNELAVGDVEEPDWTWWHHTPESRAGNMVGLSFTTPAGPAQIDIKADLSQSNLNEAIVHVTVSSISTGSFTLVVFDQSDPLKTEITIGPFSFSISNTETTSSHTVLIHPSGKLSYGKTYTVKTLSSSTLIVSHSSPPFQVPCLLRSASASLNLSDFDEVFVSLTAFGFPSSTPITLTIVEVDEDDTPTGTPFTLTGTPTTKGDSTHILTTRVETTKLQHTRRYQITQCDVTGVKTVLDGRIIFRVPARPTLTDLDFSFGTTSNTTFHLILAGTDLPVGETFLVLLVGFDEEIEVKFSSKSRGSSTELALGWPDTLQFDTAYPLVSVIHKETSTVSIPSTHLILQTGSRPNPLIVFVADSSNSDPKFCGAVERPCSSVEVAQTVIDAIGTPNAIIKLLTTIVISSTGNDENDGTESGPLLTLHAALQKVTDEQIEEWVMEIADWCRIGKRTELGLEQEGLSVVVRGGEGRKLDCTLTDSAQADEQRDSKEQGMVSVSKNTLSFVDVMFVVTSSNQGRRELGGGCVLVEMEEKGRSVSSCRVDLRESRFLGCTLSWVGKRDGVEVVGGSGFLIVGRRVKGVVLLDGVRLSSCSCVGDVGCVAFSGGVCVWEGVPFFVDRRGMVVSGCSFGSLELKRISSSPSSSSQPLSPRFTPLRTQPISPFALCHTSSSLSPRLSIQSLPIPTLHVNFTVHSSHRSQHLPLHQITPLDIFTESTNLLLHPPHSALHPSSHLSSSVVPPSSPPSATLRPPPHSNSSRQLECSFLPSSSRYSPPPKPATRHLHRILPATSTTLRITSIDHSSTSKLLSSIHHTPPSTCPAPSRRVSSHHPLFLIDCPPFVALRTLFKLHSVIVCHCGTDFLDV
ncbi:hypothetical protein BLNAU_2043 [Blattamonas nauphoetae]|uniref:Uncharacterized protein n=1 Tax=Blattamonas nauphoetae TaxID=2049346 RepID=A0ABQ9YH91_9EUKA|nr:hypothetical protein BLNAU_2043 [Blattamonas nauphoetae]